MISSHTKSFDFLVQAWRETLAARTLYPTVKVGKEYTGRGYLGLFQSAGSFKQISVESDTDTTTVLHECLHYINHENKNRIINVLVGMDIDPQDLAKLCAHLLSVGGKAYKPLSNNLVRALLKSDRGAIALATFNLLDEVLAQSTNKTEFWFSECVNRILINILGDDVVTFLRKEIFNYIPVWNESKQQYE